MNKKFINDKILYTTILIIFSFYINFYYANIGVLPIDTFAFFDTSYNILNGRHPFKDIWVTTGPFVDYLQAFFFKIFGNNWNSYIIHGSFLNALVSYLFFTTLISLNLNRIYSLFYALGLGALCYTISGTPFAYIHSYVFSLISILIFNLCIFKRENKFFFLLPLIMSMGFLSMQNPSTLINFIIIICLFYIFLKRKNKSHIYSFFAGCFTVIVLLIIFFIITKIPFEKFFQQYFLFPLTMGEYRISGSEMAHFSLYERFTFRNVIGHFKFINLFLFILLFFTIKDLIKKTITVEYLVVNIALVLTGVLLIFNQLITSNQTYIFSFIPFLAAFLHIFLEKRNSKFKKFKYLIIPITIFCIFKYHFVYNEKRKFMDLQNFDLKKTVNAKTLNSKLNGLNWLTSRYPDNPEKELQLLKESLKIIKTDNRKKLVMTDYQFLSLLTEQNLNIPNRWYTHDNNSYPLDNHKYFEFYKKHINKIFKDNNISVVYTVGGPKFSNFKIYFDEMCFDVKKVNQLMTANEIKNCD